MLQTDHCRREPAPPPRQPTAPRRPPSDHHQLTRATERRIQDQRTRRRIQINNRRHTRIDAYAGVSHAETRDYLFFSYTTLTTTGYGNPVPAGEIGQILAVSEMLTGQVFSVTLVLVLSVCGGRLRALGRVRAMMSRDPYIAIWQQEVDPLCIGDQRRCLR